MPSKPDVYLAIFDHDGVLVDSLELHTRAWIELGRRTGLNFTPEFIHQTFGWTNPSIFRRLLGDAISEDEIKRYSDLKEVCYRDIARGKVRLMEGVRGVLDARTARGVILAIGSSGPRRGTRPATSGSQARGPRGRRSGSARGARGSGVSGGSGGRGGSKG